MFRYGRVTTSPSRRPPSHAETGRDGIRRRWSDLGSGLLLSAFLAVPTLATIAVVIAVRYLRFGLDTGAQPL